MNRKSTAVLALTLLLTGCGMYAPTNTGDSGESSVTQTTPRETTTAATTAAVTTTTEAVPQEDTADLLARLTESCTSELPLSAEFFRWAAQYSGDETLPDKLYNEFTAHGYEDWRFESVSGISLKAAKDLYSGEAEKAANIHVLDGNGEDGITMTFGGDISFADNWQVMENMRATNSKLSDCISPYLIEKMNKADIAEMNNEFCFSDRGEPMEGKMWTFRAATKNVSYYAELGMDIVDLANNHCYDYGEIAFIDTLRTLRDAGIPYMGAGEDIKEASTPQYFIVEGRKIAYVAATRAEKVILTPEATEDTPGVLRCYEPAAFIEVIKEAKRNSDFVIANLHWGTEDSHDLEWVQKATARQYIDAGADLIVGAHAHCLQGVEYYKHVPIIYNLGNFWFSGYDIDTGLLSVTLQKKNNKLDLVFYPATQRDCKTTYVGGEAEGERILQNMRNFSINADFDENGVITEKN